MDVKEASIPYVRPNRGIIERMAERHFRAQLRKDLYQEYLMSRDPELDGFDFWNGGRKF